MTRNRIAWTGAWSRTHNNPRYAELLPRLDNVDRFYIDMHPWWPIRGLRRRVQLPLTAIAIGLTYPVVFCTDWRQVRLMRAPCIVDHDDPIYAPDELAALSRPNVAMIVVTTEGVRDRLLAAGVPDRIRVIPQGIVLPQVDPARVHAIRAEWKQHNSEVVVGIHQPHFEFADELGGEAMMQMYAVNDLFAVMERAHGINSRLALWLVGTPSARVEEYTAKNPWVKLLGYRAREELMDYVSAFDIGIYPRSGDVKGRSSVKVLEYMACGLPVAGFNVDEMKEVARQKAGATAETVESLVELVVSMAADKTGRTKYGARGKSIAAQYDWVTLAAQYSGCLARI
jgi:glycosyltransferase involved in cell wall biosynthesis